MAYRFLRLVDDGAVARLTLVRPPLNVLTTEMMEELGEALAWAAAQPLLKVLLLAAEGKAFSAGVDIEGHRGDRTEPMLEAVHGVFRLLRTLDCVTVAALQGPALGGGAELATFCDLVVASEAASLGQPEIKAGVFPPIAMAHYPRRVGPHRALQLVLSGRVIEAAEALRIGLVDRVVPPDRLAETVEAEVARFTSHSAAVLRLTKRALRESLDLPFDEALASLETVYHYELMVTADAQEGLRALTEKRKPVWQDR
jgi:cyclohexa-1,5-dienecarbonyl-CoA hydratase